MAQRSSSSEAVLAVFLELLAVGVFTLLAGAGDEAANIVILFMVGLWMIYLVSDAGVIAGIGNALQALISNPQNK